MQKDINIGTKSHSLVDNIISRDYINNLESVFLPYRKTGLFGFALQVENGWQNEAYDFVKDFINNYADKISEEDLEVSKRKIIPEL